MSTHRIAIMTDSTSDLPTSLATELGIEVMPLYVIFGEEHLRDGVDIDPDTFYQRLPVDPEFPKTSQPTPADFARAIEASGADEVVCLHISNRLSGTLVSANAARELVDIPVHVIDSMSVSMGLGLQAMAAARARNAGGSIEDIVAAIDHVKSTLQVVFTVETLEYLRRGGRIGAAAKLLGTALQLKPVLVVPQASGQIEAAERVHSRKRSLDRLPEYVLERIDSTQPVRACVMHGAAPEEADAVLNEMCKRANVIEAVSTCVGPIVGTHAGPGVVGLTVHVA